MDISRYRKALAALTGAATPAAGVIAALESLQVAYPSWLPAAIAAVAAFVATVAAKPNSEPVSLVPQADYDPEWPDLDEDEISRWENEGGRHAAVETKD